MNPFVTRCETCAIRHKAVCDVLSGQEILKLNRIARRKLLHPGQPIIAEGERTELFGNIVSGVVKLTKTISDGRQHIVGLLFPPDFLGRVYLPDSPYFAEAATDVELCVFSARSFEALCAEHPGLERRLFQLTLSELDAAREWMLLLARKSAEERVASFLLMIAKRVPLIGCQHLMAPAVVRFQLPLGRAEMADCLGLTIETVSRQMTRLKTKHIIELISTREIVIPSLEALEAAANASEPL